MKTFDKFFKNAKNGDVLKTDNGSVIKLSAKLLCWQCRKNLTHWSSLESGLNICSDACLEEERLEYEANEKKYGSRYGTLIKS